MKILVLCHEGNNRSVTIAHLLKYWGNDVLTAGVTRNSLETLEMLCAWADVAIITEPDQAPYVQHMVKKLDLWNIGPDRYPRPFNKDLLAIVRRFLEAHRAEYNNDNV